MSNLDTKISSLFINSPVIRSRDFVKAGIPRITLSRALAAGQVRRLARGIYCLKDFRQSEHGDLALVSGKAQGIAICLLSALRYYELTTQAPSEVWIALPNKAWMPKLDYPALRITRFSGKSWTYGVTEVKIEGVKVRITTLEKTIADCFKFRNKVGLDVALEALREAGKNHLLDRDKLWECAKVDRVSNIILPYMEALA